jgi:tripartite-type tricarboxylate transporter receptor subunit TctC
MFGLAALCAMVAYDPAAAQGYPSKPVHIVVGFGPGGPTDTIARLYGTHLGGVLNQPVIVENKPGAGSNLGADVVAKSAPDGHTLFVGGMGPLAINDALYSALAFSPERDFVPVAVLARSPLVLVVHKDLPATVKDFIAHAKAQKGKLNHSSPGVGSSPQLAEEMFRTLAGFDSTHVPYRSGPLMLEAVMKGEVQWTIDVPLTTMPQHKVGAVRALAITAPQRRAAYPDLPALAEVGFPDLTVFAWFALAAPAGTPAAVVARLNAEAVKALTTDEANQRLANIGFEPVPMSPAEAAAYLASERKRWIAVAKAHNIKVE